MMDGVGSRAAIEAARVGGHVLEVDAATAAPNDEVPQLLADALARDAAAAGTWGSLSPSHRREYVGYIMEAKREETRERRVRRSVERLREGRTGR